MRSMPGDQLKPCGSELARDWRWACLHCMGLCRPYREQARSHKSDTLGQKDHNSNRNSGQIGEVPRFCDSRIARHKEHRR
ncbi:hypothetical protein DOCECA_04955 [Pseudomonas sp. E102]